MILFTSSNHEFKILSVDLWLLFDHWYYTHLRIRWYCSLRPIMSSRSCLSWQPASQVPQQLAQQNDASVVGQGRVFYTEDRRKPEGNYRKTGIWSKRVAPQADTVSRWGAGLHSRREEERPLQGRLGTQAPSLETRSSCCTLTAVLGFRALPHFWDFHFPKDGLWFLWFLSPAPSSFPQSL